MLPRHKPPIPSPRSARGACASSPHPNGMSDISPGSRRATRGYEAEPNLPTQRGVAAIPVPQSPMAPIALQERGRQSRSHSETGRGPVPRQGRLTLAQRFDRWDRNARNLLRPLGTIVVRALFPLVPQMELLCSERPPRRSCRYRIQPQADREKYKIQPRPRPKHPPHLPEHRIHHHLQSQTPLTSYVPTA